MTEGVVRLHPRILDPIRARRFLLDEPGGWEPHSERLRQVVESHCAWLLLLRLMPPGRAADLAQRFEGRGHPAASREGPWGPETAVAAPLEEMDSCRAILEEADEEEAARLLAAAIGRRHDPDRPRRLWLPEERTRRLGGSCTEVMGVVNVTPDSFYRASRTSNREQAAGRARDLIHQGAAVVDIGGESTRPGSAAVEVEEEIARVVPVIAEVRAGDPEAVLSVDTRKSAVAEAALDAGADMVNDVSGGRHDPDLLPLVAERGVPVVLMHMRGTPDTMQDNPAYTDVVSEVCQELWDFLQAALAAGVPRGQVILDPGIGFAKTAGHNLTLLGSLPALLDLDCPLLVGTSRKSFLGKVLELEDPALRLPGTLATVALAAVEGVHMVRVHDAEPARHVVDVIRAVREAPIG